MYIVKIAGNGGIWSPDMDLWWGFILTAFWLGRGKFESSFFKNSNAQGFSRWRNVVAWNGIKYTSFLQQDSQKIILYLYRYFYGPLPRDISLNNIHYNPIPANSHALGVSLTPEGWKLRSHAGSRPRANFSRLIEKCELLPSCLTQFPKIY